MLDINDFGDAPLFAAIKELNGLMIDKKLPQIHLDVVGGFALMVRGIRDKTELTDVDYVGPDLAKEVDELAESLRAKYSLKPHWINNDVLLDGSSLEDLEITTGKLHFLPAFELEKIKIDILELKDLLRMKVIAVDTTLTRLDYGGEYTRIKDFGDIKALMARTNTSFEQLIEQCKDYLCNKQTLDIVGIYLEKGDDALQFAIREMAFINLKKAMEKQKEPKQKEPKQKEPYVRSPEISGMLDALFKKVQTENRSNEDR